MAIDGAGGKPYLCQKTDRLWQTITNIITSITITIRRN